MFDYLSSSPDASLALPTPNFDPDCMLLNLFVEGKQIYPNRASDMPPKETPSTPSADTLPSTTLIPNSSALRRSLSRLPKPVIVDLVLIWLDHPLCPLPDPVVEEDEFLMQDDETLEEKKAVYEEYRDNNVITKKTVIDRILANDWVAFLFLV